MRFSTRYVESLKPKEKRYTVYEDNSHGSGTLGLRVTPRGTKSWVHTYFVRNKVRMATLGRYPKMKVADAHAAFALAGRAVVEGGDPGRDIVIDNERRRTAPRVEDLARLYIERWAKPRKRSWKQDESMLRRDVLPIIGHLRVEDVRRRDVIDVLDRVSARGAQIQANRVLALLRKMFNFAIGRDLAEFNPCQAVAKPARENQRDRVLGDDELRLLLEKIPECEMWTPSQLALLLVIVTGQRSGEVVGALWSEIDLARGWWTIPGKRAKNRLSHRVPLSPQALAVLKLAHAHDLGEGAVFPSRTKGGVMVHSVLSKALQRNRPLIGLPHFTSHDLRRTAASHMTGMRISRLVVSKILNHVETGVTAVYDRYSYDHDKREALDAWGTRLDELGLKASLGRIAADVERRLAGRGWERRAAAAAVAG